MTHYTYDTSRFDGCPADGLYRVFTTGTDGSETRTGVVVAARGLADAYALWNTTPGTSQVSVTFRTERESTYDRTGPVA